MKKTLCLYYTRTRKTRRIMQQIADGVGAPLVEYSDGKDRRGLFGYLRSCVDALLPLPKVRIVDEAIDLREYDRVIVGMPTWVEMPCVVGKAFLKAYRDYLPEDVCIVLTHDAKNGYEKQIEKLDKLLNRPHTHHLSVQTKKHDCTNEVNAFVALLLGE